MKLALELLDRQAARFDHPSQRIDFWRSHVLSLQAQVSALTELAEKHRVERDQASGRAAENSYSAAAQLRDQRDEARRKAAKANARADAAEAELRSRHKALVEALYGPGADPRIVDFSGCLNTIANHRAVSMALTARHSKARELAKFVLKDVEIGGNA